MYFVLCSIIALVVAVVIVVNFYGHFSWNLEFLQHFNNPLFHFFGKILKSNEWILINFFLIRDQVHTSQILAITADGVQLHSSMGRKLMDFLLQIFVRCVSGRGYSSEKETPSGGIVS